MCSRGETSPVNDKVRSACQKIVSKYKIQNISRIFMPSPFFPSLANSVLIIRPWTPGHFCSIGFVASPAHGEIHPVLQKLVVLMLNIHYDIILLYKCTNYYHDNCHKYHSWLKQILLIIIYMVPQVQNRRSKYTQVVLVSDPKLYCRKHTADW